MNSSLPLEQRRIISDVAFLAGGIAGALSCLNRSRDWTGRRKRAWLLFASSMVSAAVGNAWVLGVDLIGRGDPALWFSTLFFLGALLLGLAGLSSFPSVARRGTDFARMLVDGAIIGGSIIVIVNVTYFPDLLSGQDDVAPQAFNWGLLLLDVATLTLAVLLIVRVGSKDRPALWLVSAGLALYAITDLTRAVLQSQGPFHYGTVIDLGWIAGYLLIALAGRNPAAGVRPVLDEGRDASPALGTVLVFTLLIIAALLTMRDHGAPLQGNDAATVIWLLLVVAVAVRQILLIIDNDKLRHSLERRVDERTNDLRLLTRRSELLLSSVGEGIYGVDRSGAVTFVNPAGARTLGYRPEELIGREAHATFHAVRSDGVPYPLASCYVTEAIRDGTVTNTEEDVYIQAGGRAFAVEVTATPMATDDSVQGAVVVFRDVTQRQEVDRLKSEFVSMVSHELRTPLTSIRGSLGLLAGGALGELPATALRMVALALDSSARLTRLINDILDVERIESGTMPMEIGDHQASVLVAAAVDQLQVLAAEADVHLLVTRIEGTVHADADRVVQTLINLVDNAIKFSPRHTTVEIESAVTGNMVEFRIRDQGRGIPAEKIDRVFSRFEQVDSSDAREKGGSGLGLAISRSVVERLGGRIWAESAEGQGATFRFTLPRTEPRAQAPVLTAVDSQADLPSQRQAQPQPAPVEIGR
ncbi:MAG: ATP-binding protein [Propionibacteriaceae bacterium]